MLEDFDLDCGCLYDGVALNTESRIELRFYVEGGSSGVQVPGVCP